MNSTKIVIWRKSGGSWVFYITVIHSHIFPDRYWSITSPLRYLRKRTKKRALIMITMAWIGASMWFIPVLGWNQILRRGKSQLPGNFLHFFLPESKNAFVRIVRQFCTLRNWKSKKNFIRKLFVYIFELFYFLQKMQTTFDICALYKLYEIGKRNVFIELKQFSVNFTFSHCCDTTLLCRKSMSLVAFFY